MASFFRIAACICYLSAASIFALVGCSPVYYKPNKVAAPNLSEKEQVNVALGNNYFQFAFSPVNHVGITAGYSAFSEVGVDVDEKAHLYEVGGGYYCSVPGTKQKVILDVYGGYGRGSIQVDKPLSYPSMTVSKFIIQPGIGCRTKFFDASLNWRMSDVIYSGFNYQAMPNSQGDVPQANRQYFFFEPALTIRGGYKAIKAELQIAHAYNLSGVSWNIAPDCLSAGVYVIINGYRKLNQPAVGQNK